MLELVEKLRTDQPLVHNITNVVVTNFTANGLLALGASPVMAYAEEEVEEMAGIADALVLNIGTLSSSVVRSIILAGKAANRKGERRTCADCPLHRRGCLPDRVLHPWKPCCIRVFPSP